MADWHVHCRGAEGCAPDGDELRVEFGSKRSHRVRVMDAGDRYVIRGIAARANALPKDVPPERRAWAINRATDLVGFRVDDRGRFVGEAWVPKLGLTADEFVLVARRVAIECDRLEYVLTGEDRE